MRQAERLTALRALLARVQANAKERRAELAALGLGPDAPRPERVASDPPATPRPPPRRRARERAPSPLGHFDDDWSSLLTRDLNDPSPERHPQPAEEPPPPSMPFSRVASFAPPPLPADLAKVVAQASPPSRHEAEDAEPDSEIVKAIKLAAEHPHPVVDPRDLWTGAGPELRERRPATNPPVPPRPEDLEPERDEPVLDLVRATPPATRVSSRPPPAEPLAPLETPSPASPAREEPELRRSEPPPPSPPLSLDPPPSPSLPAASAQAPAPASVAPAPAPSSFLPRGRGRRLERSVSPRKRSANRVLAALVVAAPLVGLAAWWLLDQPRRDPIVAASSPGSTSGPPASTTPRFAPSTGPQVPTSAEAVPPRTSTPSPPTSPAPPSSPTAIPPPPQPGNPHESGMLWVDADPASAIYVQGVAAGDSGKWLEVACGMKNVRLARRGLPPPGHSFPMWLGVGQTVLIPCGGSHRVALRPD